MKNLSDEISRSDSKVTRKTDDLSTELHREMANIQNGIKEINTREKEREKLMNKK